jgi:hypothetical protein
LADIGFSSTTIPKMLVNIQKQQIHHSCRLLKPGDFFCPFWMFGQSDALCNVL